MEPLLTAKRMLIWLCICPSPKSASKWTNTGHLIITILVLAGQLLSAIAHAIFLFKFGSTDLKGSIFSFMGTISFSGIFYVSISVLSMRYKIRTILEELSIIYDVHENAKTFEFLRRANDISEWMCKLYIKSAIFVVGGNVLLCNIIVLIGLIIYKGNFDVSHAFHMSRFYVPWNTSTLFGYATEQNFICYCGISFVVENSVVLLVFISLCIHHQAFYEMLEFSINEWNQPTKHPNDEKFILGLVRFHISVKDWFLSSIDVYSPILLIQLIDSTIIMATTTYYLDLQIHNLDSEVIFILSISSFAMVNLFVYCYFGKLGSDSFARMPDCLYCEMNWLRLTPKLKMYVVLIIRNMQRPIYYYGFNVAVMDLNTFIRLLRMIVTFYMMFKTVTGI